MNIHHIVAHGWSLGVLHSELSDLYKSHSEGNASPLAELPIQYANYGSGNDLFQLLRLLKSGFNHDPKN